MRTAEEGRRYQAASYRTIVDSSLNSATIQLKNLISELEILVGPFTTNAKKTISWATIGIWTILGLGSGLLLLCFITLLILCCLCTWQRCERGKLPAKILLTLIGILSIFFTVLVFVIMIGSVSGSSFCGFIGKLNEGNFDEFKNLNVTISNDLISLFRTCGDTNGSTTLGDILLNDPINLEAYNSANIFLDGLLAYNTYQTSIKSISGSVGISDIVSQWTSFATGAKSDFV